MNPKHDYVRMSCVAGCDLVHAINYATMYAFENNTCVQLVHTDKEIYHIDPVRIRFNLSVTDKDGAP